MRRLIPTIGKKYIEKKNLSDIADISYNGVFSISDYVHRFSVNLQKKNQKTLHIKRINISKSE